MENGGISRCCQCGTLGHIQRDCPVYKITSRFSSMTDFTYSDTYKHYNVPVYDTHCHLDFVFERFKHNNTSFKDFQNRFPFPDNFKGCITSFSDPTAFSSFGIWSELLTQDGIWGTFGMHPHHAKYYNANMEERLRNALLHSKAVAVGECGLDYSLRASSSVDVQKTVFKKHLALAMEYKKPLVIHSREAEDDIYSILCEHGMQEWPIHIHCFTGNHKQLHRFVNDFPNTMFGFTNLVAYPTAKTTHTVAKSVPLDRLLLETDAPYFVPESLRKGGRFSHPGNVIFVAEEIARIREQDIDVILENCRRNVRKLYNI